MSAHILVVDDSAAVQQAVMQNLQGPDRYSLAHAGSPVSALAEARRQQPDLILIDLSLGGMGGLALCESLAQDAVLREVPVVLMTVAGDPLAASLKELVAPQALIAKPFSGDALRKIVRENLADTRRAIEAREDKRETLKQWARAIAAAEGGGEAKLEECLSHYGVGLDVGLSGDLGVVGLPEVFQLLTLQSQSGQLRVETQSLALHLFFWQGRIDFVQPIKAMRALLLGRVLVAEGAIKQRELDFFLRYRRPDRLIGQQLVQLGYVSVDELREAVARQSSELVYELLRQRTGRFSFRKLAESPSLAQEFRLSLATDALLMEGYRRVDELQLIEEKLGSREHVLLPDDLSIQRFGHHNLTREEQQVLALCDGSCSIQQVVDKTPLGAFDALKGMYRLVEARLLKIVA